MSKADDKPKESPADALSHETGPVPPAHEMTADAQFLIPVLWGIPLLDHLADQLAKHHPEDVLYPDRWNWVYETKPGEPLLIYPDRVDNRRELRLLARARTEGHRIVAWEPPGS